MPIPPSPIALSIGPVSIYWYGLLIAAGTLLGAWVASREAARRGQNPDHVWNGLILALVFGLIGARLYHVFSSPVGGIGWDYYRQHPLDIIAFWNGGLRGLGIFGAVAGGLIALLIYTRWQKLDFWIWADIAIVGLPLGQAIGRWGNYFNQELYGYPTNVPWAVTIDPAHRLPGFERYEHFHPTFLYESLWDFGSFLVLLFIARRFDDRLLRGDLLLMYGILYPVGRFLVEFQRPDAWTVGGIATAQIIALMVAAASSVALILRHRLQPAAVRRPQA
jgi:phosphatidylglycerol:prolipoprotein diacylglycerol transferase